MRSKNRLETRFVHSGDRKISDICIDGRIKIRATTNNNFYKTIITKITINTGVIHFYETHKIYL